MLDRLRYRLRALFRHGALEHEMQDEMRTHLERRTEALVGRGMTPAAARLAARREFGNVGVLQEEGRDARGREWLDTLAGDLRFALRHFSRRRFTTATIVAVLSLGIAIHAFELTLLRIVTVRPPAGISSDEPLARVRGLVRPVDQPEWSGRWMPYPEVQRFAALDGVFSSVAASTVSRVVIGSGADERAATVHFVNDEYFRTLGVGVRLGPGLPHAGGATGDLTAVVSDQMWDRVLGRPDSVGQSIVVNGRQVRIAGVAPPRFLGPVPGDNPGLVLWMPLASRPIVLAASGATAFALASPDSQLFEVVGRLRDGVTADEATTLARVASAAVTGAMTQPTSATAPRIRYDADVVYLRGITDVDSDLPLVTGIWAVISILVLLVVCTNVSGLLAASAATRGHEIAVRLSLGASRQRIVRQLLTESCLLSLAGGIGGVVVYWGAFRGATRVFSEAQYYAPDMPTFALTLLSAIGVGMLFGLTPALHAVRAGVRRTLSASGPGVTGPSRLQRVLVAAQITFTQPLLVGIGMLVGALLMMTPKQLPEAVQEQVLKFSINSASLGEADARTAALQRMLTHIRETPGVVDVAPEASKRFEMKFAVPGTDSARGREIKAGYYLAKPGYFKVLDVPLLGGDDRVAGDSVRTIVIGADVARSLFGEGNAVGRYLEGAPPREERHRYLVTGVYDSRLIGESDEPVVYRMVREAWPDRYVVRTSRPAADLMIPIRSAIRAELPTTPIESWATLADHQASQGKQARLGVLVITVTVTIVLLISCIGLYGVVSLAVTQRQREIGIRMALGARAREVVSLFYRSGMKLTLTGLALGLPISLAGGFLIESIENNGLQGQPNMLLVGAGVGGVMLIVASLATVFPASQAATVDPVSVLRSE